MWDHWCGLSGEHWRMGQCNSLSLHFPPLSFFLSLFCFFLCYSSSDIFYLFTPCWFYSSNWQEDIYLFLLKSFLFFLMCYLLNLLYIWSNEEVNARWTAEVYEQEERTDLHLSAIANYESSQQPNSSFLSKGGGSTPFMLILTSSSFFLPSSSCSFCWGPLSWVSVSDVSTSKL